MTSFNSPLLPALCLLFLCPAAMHGQGLPRGKAPAPAAADFEFAYECPKCSQRIVGPEEPPPKKCPHCGVGIQATRVEGGYELKWIEVSENRWRKPLLMAGGLLVLLAAAAYGVRALRPAAKPAAKKKRQD